MSRTSLLTADELTWASRILRTPVHVDDYGAVLWKVFEPLFDPPQFWYWNFFGGEFQILPQNLFGPKIPPNTKSGMIEKVIELYRSTRPWEPADLIHRNQYVAHVAEMFQWYHGKDKSLEQCREELWADHQVDWQIGGHVFDGEVQQAGVGMGRPFSDGDFTEYDIACFEALFPHIRDGFNQCAAYTRAQIFGDAIATAVEYHPSAMFVFDAGGQVKYANNAACLLMQNETEGHSEFPMASKSALVKQVWESKERAISELACIQSVSSHALPEWPGLNLEKARLIVVNTIPQDVPDITEREKEIVLRSAMQGVKEASAELGVTVNTAHTHLRNAYAKLGVGGLTEAAAYLYLNGADGQVQG